MTLIKLLPCNTKIIAILFKPGFMIDINIEDFSLIDNTHIKSESFWFESVKILSIYRYSINDKSSISEL